MPSAVQAQSFPAVIDLTELDGSDGFTIETRGPNYDLDVYVYNGGNVTSGGDINGDGVADLVLGLTSSSTGASDYDIGTSIVVFGGSDVGNTGEVALPALRNFDSSIGFFANGLAAYDGLARSISVVGDINGDGLVDVAIGAPGVNTSDYDQNGVKGVVYVVFGGADVDSSGELPLSSLTDGSNGFIIESIDGLNEIGNVVSGADDINGDGVSDLIIGDRYGGTDAAGRSYVVFGRTTIGASGSVDLGRLDGSDGFVIDGAAARDFSGSQASSAGDLNNDGVSDIIIAAPGAFAERSDGLTGGVSYVVFGGPNVGASGSLSLSSLDGNNGFSLDGFQQSSNPFIQRMAISKAGDVNDDGISDVIVGIGRVDVNGNESAARSFVVFGANDIGASGSLDIDALDGSTGFAVNGVRDIGFSSSSVSDAGDVNGDGVDDFIIGEGALLAWNYFVVLGGAGLGSEGLIELSTLDGTNGFKAFGPALSGFYNVSAAGDVNEDGIDDVLLSGFPGAHVVFGMQTPPPSTLTCNGLLVTVNLALGQTPTSGPDVIQGTEGADTIRALGGDDTICGLGGDDLINAGGGDDYVDAGPGNDTVFGIFGDDTLRGNSGADRILGGPGKDLINGDGGFDRLNGGSGDDRIFGGHGNDGVFGQGGDDILFGGPGNDLIIGANGADTINGGSGSNNCALDDADSSTDCQ